MPTKLPERQSARLLGHKGAVHALSYSSGSGQYILSGSSDRTVRLWNPAKAASSDSRGNSNALVQTYEGAHGYEVLSLAVAQDNSRFVSGGGDKSVFLWDVSTAQTIRRYGGGPGSHVARIECVAFGGDRDSVVLSGSLDSTVRLWDSKASNPKPIMVLSEAKDSVSSLVVMDHEIMTGSIDGRVRVYDLRMGMVNADVIGRESTGTTKF
ncbi:hypothetical protein FH972_024615 [Carpinus fangiana]|uniref:Uncharacterized protein n=1 Tax=Carpinus fangiana TaxID=176857 RepID=A0A5N6KYU4_9ROSI|nr:hypothetical protein FH972_024615 [Carpinus fangiana]